MRVMYTLMTEAVDIRETVANGTGNKRYVHVFQDGRVGRKEKGSL